MPTPKKSKPDATEMRAIIARLHADQEISEPEFAGPCCDLTLPLTSLESLALIRCRFKTNEGTTDEPIYRDVCDVSEIKNLLSIMERATAPSGGLSPYQAFERADRVASELVTAYIWARLKQSVQGETSLDLHAMGAATSPEFQRALYQLGQERERERERCVLQ